MTYGSDKSKAYVEPFAKALEAPVFLPCDVRVQGQLENVFQVAEQTWGKFEFALHSIASAPKQDLHSPLSQCSRDGFLQAMEVSCYSFIRMAHLAAPLMRDGGTILTMTYYGAEKVIENYNVMGPVKAALESAVRYPPTSSDQSEFGCTLSLQGRLKRARPLESSISTNCWSALRNVHLRGI